MDEENPWRGTKRKVDDHDVSLIDLTTDSPANKNNVDQDSQDEKRRKQNSTVESFVDLTEDDVDQRSDEAFIQENCGDGPETEMRGDAEARLLVKLAEMSPSCPIGCLLKVLRDVLAGVLVGMTDDDIILEAITRADGLETGMAILEDRLPKNHVFLIDRFIGIRQLFSDRKAEVVAEQMIALAASSSSFDPDFDDVEDRANRIVEALFLNPPIESSDENLEEQHNAGSVATVGSAPAFPEFPLPDHWSQTRGWSLVDVPADSDEYASVAKAFHSDSTDLIVFARPIVPTVLKITRVQNPGLWRQYQLKRSLISEKVGQGELNERHLWHGTGTNIAQTISLQGFDFRVDVKNGRVWGDGIYFAPKPGLAIAYGAQSVQMAPVHQAPARGARGGKGGRGGKGARKVTFGAPSTTVAASAAVAAPAAAVAAATASTSTANGHTASSGICCVIYTLGVCGRATQGKAGLRRPPFIDPKDTSKGLFDSCYNYKNGNMVIIFDNSQVYPEYIVYYNYVWK